MKRKSKWTEQRDQFFKDKFNLYFKQWKDQDRAKHTQGELARRICEIWKKNKGKCKVTNSYVSEWSRGIWFPESYLPEIAEVLGVKEEDFLFQSTNDLYRRSSEYMTQLGNTETLPYCETIGLDFWFLYSLRSVMGTDFDKTFPLWFPFRPNPDMSSLDHYVRTSDSLATSADMEGDLNVFQCRTHDSKEHEPDGRLVTMGRADLDYLRDVQEDVKDYIEFLFLKRKKEMDKETEEANQKARRISSDGGYEFRNLDAKELNQIDKYFHGYTDKKPKSSGIRKATQEDYDRFAEDGTVVTDKKNTDVQITKRILTKEEWNKDRGGE